MSDKSRVFGDNVRLYSYNNHIDESKLAEDLGYSLIDVQKIIDGRLILDSDEKNEISKYLNVDIDRMYAKNDYKNYADAGCMECRGHDFDKPENKKLILDIFDWYVDIEEALR